MVFSPEVDYNYLQCVLMWIIIIFDMDKDEKYGQLCSYLTLIMYIFALQVIPTIQMCFNYMTFDLLFKYLFFRFRDYAQ